MKKILTILSIILIISSFLIGFLLNYHQKIIGGSAIDGKTENGKYFLAISENEYKEVDRNTWIINLILWIVCIVNGFLAGLSLIFLISVYLLIRSFKDFKEFWDKHFK
jgi:hypothetical protein